MAARSFLYGGDSGGAVAGVGFSSSKPIDSFFVSGSSPSFLGSRSMVSFEDKSNNGSGRPFFQTFDQEDNGDDEYDEYFHQPEKKRRLKADQVRFLEKTFESENKLEPERKIQLAKDLGLQPRQIAIWFQNRRARWKTKQLEKDFDVLQESYNKLKANYENLVKEQEKLKSEVLDLSDKLLLQETEKGASDSSSTKSLSEPLELEQIKDCLNDEDVSKTSNLGDSSYVFEQDQSDESLDEDTNLGKMFVNPLCGYMLPKIETAEYVELDAVNSCYLGFSGHDQDQEQDETFGFWSY